MHRVVAEADSLARGTPVLQIAVDGWWEHAQCIPLPTTDALVASTADDVAVEVLWPGPPIVFVGARYLRTPPPLDSIAAGADFPPSELLRMLADLRASPPEHAELGAVNAWRSVGPLVVDTRATESQIAAALRARPDLARCGHPIALEVVLPASRQAWCAIETGVDAARIASLLT